MRIFCSFTEESGKVDETRFLKCPEYKGSPVVDDNISLIIHLLLMFKKEPDLDYLNVGHFFENVGCDGDIIPDTNYTVQYTLTRSANISEIEVSKTRHTFSEKFWDDLGQDDIYVYEDFGTKLYEIRVNIKLDIDEMVNLLVG